MIFELVKVGVLIRGASLRGIGHVADRRTARRSCANMYSASLLFSMHALHTLLNAYTEVTDMNHPLRRRLRDPIIRSPNGYSPLLVFEPLEHIFA